MRINTRLYSILALTIIINIAKGQVQGALLVDSLLTELPKHGVDTARAHILDDLSFAYSTIDPDKGIETATQLLQLSEQLKWEKGIAKSYAVLGINYAAKSEHAKALSYYNRALKKSKELGDRSSIAGNWANISLIYIAKSDYPKALENAFNALTIYENIKDKKNIAIIQENIGTIYSNLGDKTKAMEHYTYSLKIYKEINDIQSIARCYGNIGTLLDSKGKYDGALKSHLMALKANTQIGNKNGIQINLANVGYVHLHQKKYAQALEYQFKALAVSQELNSKNSIAINTGNIGETYFEIAKDRAYKPKGDELISSVRSGNLSRALKYLEEAVRICREIGFSAPLIEFTRYLSEGYYLAGDYKRAHLVFKEHTAVRDSIYSVQNRVLVSDLEAKRALELKDKNYVIKSKEIKISKLEEEQKRNERIIYFFSSVVLLLLIGITYKSLQSYKKSTRSLIKEKEHHLQRIKTQNEALEEIAHIQAHEVSGPIATILGLVSVFNEKDVTDPINKTVIEGITSVTHDLDEKVKKVIKKKNELSGI